MAKSARYAVFLLALLTSSAGMMLQQSRHDQNEQKRASLETADALKSHSMTMLHHGHARRPVTLVPEAVANMFPTIETCIHCDEAAELDWLTGWEWSLFPEPGPWPNFQIVGSCQPGERFTRIPVEWGTQWFPSPFVPLPVAWIGQTWSCAWCGLCQLLGQKTSLLQIVKPESPVLVNYSFAKQAPLSPQFSALEQYARAGGDAQVALLAATLEAHLVEHHKRATAVPETERLDPTKLAEMAPEKLALLQSNQTSDLSGGAETLVGVGAVETTRECKRAQSFLRKYSRVSVNVNFEWPALLEQLANNSWTTDAWAPEVLASITPEWGDSRPFQLCQRSLKWKKIADEYLEKLYRKYPNYELCIERNRQNCLSRPASKPDNVCKWDVERDQCVAVIQGAVQCEDRFNEIKCEWELPSPDACTYCEWMDGGIGAYGKCETRTFRKEVKEFRRMDAKSASDWENIFDDAEDDEENLENGGERSAFKIKRAKTGDKGAMLPKDTSKEERGRSQDMCEGVIRGRGVFSQSRRAPSTNSLNNLRQAREVAADEDLRESGDLSALAEATPESIHKSFIQQAFYCSKCEDKLNLQWAYAFEWVLRSPDGASPWPNPILTYSCEPTKDMDTDRDEYYDQYTPLVFAAQTKDCVRCALCSLHDSFTNIVKESEPILAKIAGVFGGEDAKYEVEEVTDEVTDTEQVNEADEAKLHSEVAAGYKAHKIAELTGEEEISKVDQAKFLGESGGPMLLQLKKAGYGKRSMGKELRAAWENLKLQPTAVLNLVKSIQNYFTTPVPLVPEEKENKVKKVMQTAECIEAAKHRDWSRSIGLFLNLEWPALFEYIFNKPENVTGADAWTPEILLFISPGIEKSHFAKKCLESLKDAVQKTKVAEVPDTKQVSEDDEANLHSEVLASYKAHKIAEATNTEEEENQ